MKWNKSGKIFDPKEHQLFKKCETFAQSPQSIVFDDFVRVYFSTRELDTSNKFLSQIAYVDFTKDFQKVIKVSTEEIIKLGALGCYDEHGIFPLNVIPFNEKLYGFIGGWNRRVSVLIDGAIGLAISEDNGNTFTRIGDGPIMSPNLKEPFLVADPFVKLINNTFHMWYIFGSKWVYSEQDGKHERIYKIAYAKSIDGINWIRDGNYIIADVLKEDECQALPTVIEINGVYHMYFCYRYATNFRTEQSRGYKLGYAHSIDMVNWIRDDSKAGIELSNEGWDSEMMCYPNIVKVDDKIYMLYNGNNFGKCGFGIAELEF
jgi:predicted GH43/DUF377 family glycosyl hydrolase